MTHKATLAKRDTSTQTNINKEKGKRTDQPGPTGDGNWHTKSCQRKRLAHRPTVAKRGD